LRDGATDLDHMGAREYYATLGRFISPDPENAGADPASPGSWNMYSYAYNNPLSYIDPSGLGACPVDSETGVEKPCLEGLLYEWFHRQWLDSLFGRTTQKIVEVASRPRDPSCIANYTGVGATIGGFGGGAVGSLGFAGGPAGLATTPTFSMGGAALGGSVGGLGGIVMCASGSGLSSGGSGGVGQTPNRVTNPKHHPNSSSPEPKNVQQLFEKSIPDKSGVRWAKDADGTIHRFSRPSNGESHWNGSTKGASPIRLESIPIEIRRALR
jgi:RHS repeat-associated protein